MAPKHSAEVLSSGPTCKTAMMSLTEKIPVLGKLHANMSYAAAGCEFILP